MAKLNTKGMLHTSLLMFCMWHITGGVGAVDVTLYESTGCVGSALSCLNVDQNLCCYSTDTNTVQGSVGITSSSDCTLSTFYSDGSCANQVGAGVGDCCSLSGDGNQNQYIAAKWINICRRRSLLGGVQPERPVGCEGRVAPSAVVFTEHGKEGKWVLESANATGLFSLLRSLPDGEKVDWLRSQGASYNAL